MRKNRAIGDSSVCVCVQVVVRMQLLRDFCQPLLLLGERLQLSRVVAILLSLELAPIVRLVATQANPCRTRVDSNADHSCENRFLRHLMWKVRSQDKFGQSGARSANRFKWRPVWIPRG